MTGRPTFADNAAYAAQAECCDETLRIFGLLMQGSEPYKYLAQVCGDNENAMYVLVRTLRVLILSGRSLTMTDAQKCEMVCYMSERIKRAPPEWFGKCPAILGLGGLWPGRATPPVSAAVAIADKADYVAAFASIDKLPTGSSDPLAIRRAANGLVRWIAQTPWGLAA